MASNSLTTVYSWSLALNNLISVSLMKDAESKFNKFFVFLNLTPSDRSEVGRQYNFQNSVSFKINGLKLFELYTAINAYVKGQARLIGKFSIINDTSKSTYGTGGLKTLYLNYSPGEEDKNYGPGISLVASAGEKKVFVNIPAPAALGFAEVCKKIFDLYLDMDVSEFTPYQAGGGSGNGEYRKASAAYPRKDNGFSAPSGGSEDRASQPPSFDEVPF